MGRGIWISSRHGTRLGLRKRGRPRTHSHGPGTWSGVLAQKRGHSEVTVVSLKEGLFLDEWVG